MFECGCVSQPFGMKDLLCFFYELPHWQRWCQAMQQESDDEEPLDSEMEALLKEACLLVAKGPLPRRTTGVAWAAWWLKRQARWRKFLRPLGQVRRGKVIRPKKLQGRPIVIPAPPVAPRRDLVAEALAAAPVPIAQRPRKGGAAVLKRPAASPAQGEAQPADCIQVTVGQGFVRRHYVIPRTSTCADLVQLLESRPEDKWRGQWQGRVRLHSPEELPPTTVLTDRQEVCLRLAPKTQAASRAAAAASSASDSAAHGASTPSDAGSGSYLPRAVIASVLKKFEHFGGTIVDDAERDLVIHVKGLLYVRTYRSDSEEKTAEIALQLKYLNAALSRYSFPQMAAMANLARTQMQQSVRGMQTAFSCISGVAEQAMSSLGEASL